MLFAADKSRSRLIRDSACAIAIGWIAALFVYQYFSRYQATGIFAVIDGSLALFFFYRSRGAFFSVPLFFVHCVQVIYQLTIILTGITTWFVLAVVMNRLFELSVVYVFLCALWRWRQICQYQREAFKRPRRERA